MPRIAILASQYFDWGTYGGFGSMSRKLAESLARAGVSVSVIVPRRKGQAPREQIDGVEVESFPAFDLGAARRLIRESRADIFHSQDPTVLTYLAQRVAPERVHLVTCRDPRDRRDWWIELRYATARRRMLTPLHYLTESGPLVRAAVRGAHGVFCPAQFLRDKVQRMYSLRVRPGFLPNLIDVPTAVPAKSERPTFAFVARFDKRKRPGMFLDLARRFPDFRFVAVGRGSAAAESGYDAGLRERYRKVENLEMPGFVNRFAEPERLERILADAWVLVCTAAREGLPLTFLEAAAQGCAVVSAVDPDGFATRFGTRVENDDFAAGVEKILADSPFEKGRAARRWVEQTHETSVALARHLEVYEASSTATAHESRPV